MREPDVRLALHGYEPQPQSPLVRHEELRQPREGEALLRAPQAIVGPAGLRAGIRTRTGARTSAPWRDGRAAAGRDASGTNAPIQPARRRDARTTAGPSPGSRAPATRSSRFPRTTTSNP